MQNVQLPSSICPANDAKADPPTLRNHFINLFKLYFYVTGWSTYAG